MVTYISTRYLNGHNDAWAMHGPAVAGGDGPVGRKAGASQIIFEAFQEFHKWYWRGRFASRIVAVPVWRQKDIVSFSGRYKKKCRDKDTASNYRKEKIAILPTPRN